MAVFWDVVQCSPVNIGQCFRRAYCFHDQGDGDVDIVSSVETSVSIYRSTRRNISEDDSFHTATEEYKQIVIFQIFLFSFFLFSRRTWRQSWSSRFWRQAPHKPRSTSFQYETVRPCGNMIRVYAEQRCRRSCLYRKALKVCASLRMKNSFAH
jgi:hypothetical protein